MAGTQFVIASHATFMATVAEEVNAMVEKNAWGLIRLSTMATPKFADSSLAAMASQRCYRYIPLKA